MPKSMANLSACWQSGKLPEAKVLFAFSSSIYPMWILSQKKAKREQKLLQKIFAENKNALLKMQGQEVTLFGEQPLYFMVDAQGIPSREWAGYLKTFFSSLLNMPEVIFFYLAPTYQEVNQAERIASRVLAYKDCAVLSGELSREQKKVILLDKVRAANGKIDTEALDFLLQESISLDSLLQEVQKLCFAFPDQTITTSDIQEVFSSSVQVVAPSLFFALVRHEQKKVEEIVTALRFQKQSPIGLIALLFSMAQRKLSRTDPRSRLFLRTLFQLEQTVKGMDWPKEFDYDDLRLQLLKLASYKVNSR